MSDSPVGRKLVVCCDGTNNTLTADTHDTNVLKLHAHLCRHRTAAHVLYYDPGVGTPNDVPSTDFFDWIGRNAERFGGLVSGRGVYDNIAQAYLFLMREWHDKRDEIYCFGFSRGAFTARCVVGMINLFGLMRPEHEPMLPTLIRIYFSQREDAQGLWPEITSKVRKWFFGSANLATRGALAAQIRTLFSAERLPDIHWVGVWDTVESVGLPGPLARSNPATATLHDKPRIRNVRHALSLDEHRWSFEPRLYDEAGDIATGGQTLKQRWFPGAHCDIGGSEPNAEAGLPDAAFAWMLGEVAADLGVPPAAPSTAVRLRHDPLWRTPWWALAGMSLRHTAPRVSSGQRFEATEDDGGSVTTPARSTWERRRPLGRVVAAVVLGAVFLFFSGLALLRDWPFDLALVSDAYSAAMKFARFQTYALPWAHGNIDPPATLLAYPHPAWAMVWDLPFIACWGYLLARVASRAFTWLAGSRRATSTLPWWRWLGFAPLALVGGDVVEDLLTLSALAASGLGTQWGAAFLLWAVGVASCCKWLGLMACMPLLGVRLMLMVSRRGATPAPD
jgi:uncharacterized protein (DUF2235 family)